MTHPTNRMLQASEDMTSLTWPHISSLSFRPESGAGKKKKVPIGMLSYAVIVACLSLSHRFLSIHLLIYEFQFSFENFQGSVTTSV